MSNFVDNQAVGGVMVMDMSSLGLLHSWSNSGFLDEVPPSLHQVSTDVSGYLNVPSPNCGSNLTKRMNNLSDSNKLGSEDSNIVSKHQKFTIFSLSDIVNNDEDKKRMGTTWSNWCTSSSAATPGMYPHPPLIDVIIQPYMMKPQGLQVSLVPIPKLKPQAVALVPKSSKKVEKKKS
ncbi:hypothetical protein KY290_021641 [Solanum tuberosum]|uniref:Uncharacterized protein n=1 Tax=Solanum tuberosum TaxID=4113 RepID=A0ABQ7V253_SOLTU|nr:hypothetical protein KY290_021641 [Solanum tuberosum]